MQPLPLLTKTWEAVENAWTTSFPSSCGLPEDTLNRARNFIENKVLNLPLFLEKLSQEFYGEKKVDKQQCQKDCSEVYDAFLRLLKENLNQEDLTGLFLQVLCTHFKTTLDRTGLRVLNALYQQQLLKYRYQLLEAMDFSKIPLAQQIPFKDFVKKELVHSSAPIYIEINKNIKMYVEIFLQKTDAEQFNDLSNVKSAIFSHCQNNYKQ